VKEGGKKENRLLNEGSVNCRKKQRMQTYASLKQGRGNAKQTGKKLRGRKGLTNIIHPKKGGMCGKLVPIDWNRLPELHDGEQRRK